MREVADNVLPGAFAGFLSLLIFCNSCKGLSYGKPAT